MDVKVEAIPREGLILNRIKPREIVNGSVIIDLSSTIKLQFKLEDGFDPTKYLNQALMYGRDTSHNVVYLLFTNRAKPRNTVDLSKSYLISPNGNFFYGMSVDGLINPVTHTLGEIAFSIDEKFLRDKENSFPDKRPDEKDHHAHGDTYIHKVSNFDYGKSTEVILPIHFEPNDYKKVIKIVKRISKKMQEKGYTKKHYCLIFVPRGNELEGIEGFPDGGFLYSTIQNTINIGTDPRCDGLGGLKPADLTTRIEKNRQYLTPFFRFVT